jgi:hypothetical protein
MRSIPLTNSEHDRRGRFSNQKLSRSASRASRQSHLSNPVAAIRILTQTAGSVVPDQPEHAPTSPSTGTLALVASGLSETALRLADHKGEIQTKGKATAGFLLRVTWPEGVWVIRRANYAERSMYRLANALRPSCPRLVRFVLFYAGEVRKASPVASIQAHEA